MDSWLSDTQLNARGGTALIPVGIGARGVLDLHTGALAPLADTPKIVVQRAALSPDGRWVAGYTVDALVLWDARTGRLVRKTALDALVKGHGVPGALAFSDDSRALGIALPVYGTPSTLVVSLDVATGKTLAAASFNGVVTALAFGDKPSVLVVAGFGTSRGSVVVVRDGNVAVSSTDDADIPLKLALDPSRKVAATISQDGGVRVWDLQSGALRATLAEFEDGEWIAATPGGAYTGTPEVASRIGWVFEGPVERFDFSQFAASFRDPDVVAQRLKGAAVDTTSHPDRPPSLALTAAPPRGQTVDAAIATVSVHASSWDRVDVVRFFADGRPVAERGVCAADGAVDAVVPLLAGTNRITAVAFDALGFASNEVSVDIAASRADLPKPDVWVVAVGVGAYKHLPPRFQLDGPAGDASGIAALFRAMEGRTYAHAHVVELVDDAATPSAIRDAVASLAAMKPTDVGVVFFAGHGIKPSDADDMVFATGGFAVAPDGKRFDPASFTRDAVGWKDIAGKVEGLKGRVLLMLDACHSGHFSHETVVENDELAASLVHGGRAGGVVFAASKGGQYSYETGNARALVLEPSAAAEVKLDPTSPHGFFTGALLGAVGDAATDRNGDGAIQLSELVDEVSRRVSVATRGLQTPWIVRRDLFGDFKIADAAAP